MSKPGHRGLADVCARATVPISGGTEDDSRRSLYTDSRAMNDQIVRLTDAAAHIEPRRLDSPPLRRYDTLVTHR